MSENLLWPSVYESFCSLCSLMIASLEANAARAEASAEEVVYFFACVDFQRLKSETSELPE